jgi:hypothetical protein
MQVNDKQTVRLVSERPLDPEGFIGLQGGAELVDCSVPTLRRRLTNKELTRYKFGSRTLLKVRELLALVRPA